MDILNQLKPYLGEGIQSLKSKYGNNIQASTLRQILNDPTNNTDPLVALFKNSFGGDLTDEVLAPLADALNKL